MALRSAFKTISTITLIGVWFVALNVGLATGSAVAPAMKEAVDRYEAENFAQIEKPLELSGFTNIEAGSTEVVVTQGNRFLVTLSGTERDVADSEARVSDGTLQMERRFSDRNCLFFCHTRRTRLTIVMPLLEELQLQGSSDGRVSGFSGGTITLQAHGSSQIEASIAPASLNIVEHGASHIALKGTAGTLTVELSGASSLDAYDFPVKIATVDLSGASRAMINASQSITGEAGGASHVFYKNAPVTVQVETHGASNVEQRDEDREEVW